MEAPKQDGFGLIGIIMVVAIVAVGIGAYVSLSTPTESLSGSADFVADPEKSGIENIAQNIAETATEGITQVVEESVSSFEEVMETDSSMVVEEPVVAQSNPIAVEEPTVIETAPAPASVVAGTFEDYSSEKLALAVDGTVVLFFHANWCPSCRGLESDLNANLGDIPANTHILKLDYDTETALKKKYSVIRQHTLVVVDADGNEIKKLTGLTNTLSQVAKQL
jgi:thiol-disulfide isomerase/thioredoxin